MKIENTIMTLAYKDIIFMGLSTRNIEKYLKLALKKWQRLKLACY